LETETWQLGVIQNKMNENHTYLVATNYWTPLNDDNYKNEEDEEIMNILDSMTTRTKPKSNNLMRQLARRREHKIIINSGATSHFMSEDLNLPSDGLSNK
jgi:hypothetical protein